MKPLSDDAMHILSAMSAGKLLRIPRDGSGPRLIDPPRRISSFGQVPVSSRIVFQLQQSAAIEKVSTVAALSALGLKDADKAEYWVCILQNKSGQTGSSSIPGSESQ